MDDEILRRYQEGDPEAVEIVIEEIEDFIYWLAHRFAQWSKAPIEDLMQASWEGALEALSRCDPARNGAVKQYIKIWARNKLFKVSRLYEAPVRLSRSAKAIHTQTQIKKVWASEGLMTVHETAERLDVDVDLVYEAIAGDRSVLLQDSIGEDMTLEDVLTDDRDAVDDERLDAVRILESLVEFRETIIEDRMIDIWDNRILGDDKLREVGERWGVSREYIRRLEKRLKNAYNGFCGEARF